MVHCFSSVDCFAIFFHYLLLLLLHYFVKVYAICIGIVFTFVNFFCFQLLSLSLLLLLGVVGVVVRIP